MLTGIYSAAAGMAAQQVRLDAVANDLANVSTTGYKTERIAFRDLVYGGAEGGPVGAGAAATALGRSFRQGALVEGRDALSVALDGPGFFQVRRADGSLGLTRAGDFRLDAQRQLVTGAGERLVPPIEVPAGTAVDEITIATDGTVAARGAALGRLVVVDVPTPTGLLAVGTSTFVATQASGAPVAAGARTTVRQGFVEAANVDVASAMAAVIEAQRGFELASRAIRTQDTMLEIANGLRR